MTQLQRSSVPGHHKILSKVLLQGSRHGFQKKNATAEHNVANSSISSSGRDFKLQKTHGSPYLILLGMRILLHLTKRNGRSNTQKILQKLLRKRQPRDLNIWKPNNKFSLLRVRQKVQTEFKLERLVTGTMTAAATVMVRVKKKSLLSLAAGHLLSEKEGRLGVSDLRQRLAEGTLEALLWAKFNTWSYAFTELQGL